MSIIDELKQLTAKYGCLNNMPDSEPFKDIRRKWRDS